jgi:hypothetical protein
MLMWGADVNDPFGGSMHLGLVVPENEKLMKQSRVEVTWELPDEVIQYWGLQDTYAITASLSWGGDKIYSYVREGDDIGFWSPREARHIARFFTDSFDILLPKLTPIKHGLGEDLLFVGAKSHLMANNRRDLLSGGEKLPPPKDV